MASDPSADRSAGQSLLFEDADWSLSLSVYPPGMKQEPHAHTHPSVAILLAGSLLEQVGNEEFRARPGTVGLKPDGCRHSNAYGDEGAILLSLRVQSPGLWKAAGDRLNWKWKTGCLHLSRMAASALRRNVAFPDLAAELLAGRPASTPASPGPPTWLSCARAELMEQPDVPLDELALAAGVHRVHLCRSFSRWYDESISGFRMRRRTEIALRNYLHRGSPAAAAAVDAGFADQSHFARTVKRVVGVTPGSLRRILPDVT